MVRAHSLPRLPVVGDAGEPPAQFNRGRKLAALLEDGPDRSSLTLRDDEHRRHVGIRTKTGNSAGPRPTRLDATAAQTATRSAHNRFPSHR